MKRIGLSAALLWDVVGTRWAAGADLVLLLGDFEAAPQGWNYVGGQESPGAKRSLVAAVPGLVLRTTERRL